MNKFDTRYKLFMKVLLGKSLFNMRIVVSTSTSETSEVTRDSIGFKRGLKRYRRATMWCIMMRLRCDVMILGCKRIHARSNNIWIVSACVKNMG